MSDAGSGRVVILVGHGAAARDCPRELVSRLKALEGRRMATGGPPSEEEIELDRKVRRWPRTPENDPYREGLMKLAEKLAALVAPAELLVAYNEFCAPTIEEAIEAAREKGAREIVVVPSMLTPGGIHSEVEIPEILGHVRERYPELDVRYAWPFDLGGVAALLAARVSATG
ncbi:sirohydrochlorin chelatase [Polyangium aurulentum]|uniref:sirohydrochlorin chelatase n=1 Tax=Polyangium aurulentum TaxID=2567896 RepID=UPI0010AE5F9B|nr:CbiX/SirB N-terminal domain-containing protein [Polyangium aurulentum]UQA58908.1 CbiX/SirB N-terminal domain-containing protein [Polyangium aurulentum]